MESRLVRSFVALSAVAVQFLVPSVLQAQVKVGSRELQIHAFLQQGFARSTNNNFLSMRSNGGSFSMTDGGVNLSMKLTPKLRVGAQLFSRNIGDIGNGKVQLDWAYADYKFNDYFGVRAGKVKTILGLFNDTQDMEFVHTFALLPQSVYPTDQRATTIAHVGGDIYGDISLKRAGRLNYVLYAGERPDDPRGGYYIGTRDGGAPISRYKSTVVGGDLRWVTPIDGLVGGYSHFHTRGYVLGALTSVYGQPIGIPGGLPFRDDVNGHINVYYGDFQRGKIRAFAEYQLSNLENRLSGIPFPPSSDRHRAWYVAGTYRVHPKVEFGSYYTDYRSDRRLGFAPTNGIRGPVVSARFDINKFWNVKAEEHFMEGFADPIASRTFYPSSNPQGLKPRSTVFLLRTGFVF